MATTKVPVELSSTPGIVDNSNATAITIDSSEQVGIGTTSPSRLLDIENSTAGGSTLVSLVSATDGNVQLLMGDTASDTQGKILYNNDGDYMALNTNDAERMRINSSGQVGIGSTSPSDELHVKGGSSSAFIRVDNSADGHDTGFNIYQNGSRKWEIHSDDSNSDALDFRPAGVQKFTMTQDGKFGIGTASPDDTLDIMGGAYDQIRIGSNKTDNTNKQCGIVSTMYTNNSVSLFQGFFQNGVNTLYYGSADGAHRGITSHVWYVNSGYNATSGHSEAMRITSGGKVYINRTSHYITAADQLAVSGRIAATSEGSSSGAFNRGTDTGTIIQLLYNGSGKGSITTDGSNVAYNTSSDARLKNVLGDAKGLDIVNQLNPVNFEWKETGDIQDGLIAQEVEPLIPEAVSNNKETGFYEMDYSKLVTPLIKAIQELSAEVEKLKQQINK